MPERASQQRDTKDKQTDKQPAAKRTSLPEETAAPDPPAYDPANLQAMPPRKQQQAVLRMQRLHGNRATRQTVGVIQRQGLSRIGVKELGENHYALQPPFGYKEASTYEQASDTLYNMAFDLNQSAAELGGNELANNAAAQLENAAAKISAKTGNLTEADARKLMSVTVRFYDAMKDTVAGPREDFINAMQKFRGDSSKIDGTRNELAEALHFAFINNADEDAIQQIKGMLGAIDKYKGALDKTISTAEMLEGIAISKLPKFVDRMKKASDKFGEFMSKVGDTLEAIRLVFEFAEESPGENFEMINKFEATIDTISFGMGFVKAVPALGMMWSEYYEPLAKACIKQMKIIAKLQDVKERQYLATVKERHDSGAPLLPDNIERSFPGGQPVMNYMWSLVNGKDAQMEPEARQWFKENAERLNNAAGKDDVKIQFEEAEFDIWNPIDSLMAEDKMIGLEAFLQAHKATVWAMLYGDLPHNI